jgi:hypothetical protein
VAARRQLSSTGSVFSSSSAFMGWRQHLAGVQAARPGQRAHQLRAHAVAGFAR